MSDMINNSELNNEDPNISLQSEFFAGDVQEPGAAYLYLDQIPHTGFGALLEVSLFFIAIILWSMAIVYFLLSNKFRSNLFAWLNIFKKFNDRKFGVIDKAIFETKNQTETKEKKTNERALVSDILSANTEYEGKADFLSDNSENKDPQLTDFILEESKRQGLLLSEGSVQWILEKAGYDARTIKLWLYHLSRLSKNHFPREDGYISLEKEKVTRLVEESGLVSLIDFERVLSAGKKKDALSFVENLKKAGVKIELLTETLFEEVFAIHKARSGDRSSSFLNEDFDNFTKNWSKENVELFLGELSRAMYNKNEPASTALKIALVNFLEKKDEERIV